MRAIEYTSVRPQSDDPVPFAPKGRPERLPPRTRLAAVVIVIGVIGALFLSQVNHAPRTNDLLMLTQAAKAGESGAQLQLGLAYREGLLGLAVDETQARYWVHRAALGGNDYAAGLEGHAPPLSFAAKGLRFLDQIGTVILRSGSTDRIADAAKAGDPIAQYQLAMRYRDGSWGVARDEAASRLWLERAAAGGNPVAMQTLARSFQAGEHGFSRDPQQARLWEQRAAATP